MLSNTSLDFILGMGIIDHDNITDNIENKKEILRLQVPLEVSYFARNIYETETVTSGLCYIKSLIFLENKVI